MFKINMKLVCLFLYIFVVAVSCDEEEDDHKDDGEHTQAKGFIFEDETGEIYRYFKGDITGTIALNVGETLQLSVHFLDNDEEEIGHDDDHDEEDYLVLTGYDEQIVLIQQIDSHDDDHDDDHDEHAMTIELFGVRDGTTSFKLELWHGEDHTDYETVDGTPIQVTVNQVDATQN